MDRRWVVISIYKHDFDKRSIGGGVRPSASHAACCEYTGTPTAPAHSPIMRGAMWTGGRRWVVISCQHLQARLEYAEHLGEGSDDPPRQLSAGTCHSVPIFPWNLDRILTESSNKLMES
jgi:hypothetical protein